MPTLIRLFVFLVILAGLGFAAMLALTIFVDPGEKEISYAIPARDLAVEPARPAPIVTTPAPAPSPALPEAAEALPE